MLMKKLGYSGHVPILGIDVWVRKSRRGGGGEDEEEEEKKMPTLSLPRP